MLDSLLALLWCLLLVGLCYGVGSRVVRSANTLLERFVFAVPLGMGIVAFVLLALGLLRLFVTPVFYGILALGLPGWFFLIRDAKVAKPIPVPASSTASGTDQSRSMLGLIAGAIFFVLGLCTLIAALAPPGGSEWDALCYHLTVPKTYLREHRIFYIPYDHHSNFPFLLQMLYTLMLGVGSVGGAKLCHWLCGVLLTASVYTYATRQWPGETGKRIGIAAALLIASCPIILWEASTAYVDLATALFTWLAVYALLAVAPPAPNNGGARGDIATASATSTANSGSSIIGGGGGQARGLTILLSALLMGFAIGTKLTVLGFWGITLAGIIGSDILRERRITPELVKRVLLWGGISLALAAPWLLRSYFYTGSPVYPYFYNLFPGRYWNAENAAQYAADQATLGLGKQPLFLLLAPWLMNIPPTAGKFNEYGFAFAPALVPLLLAAPFKPGRFGKSSVALALFTVVAYVFWFFLMQQSRYFLPVLPMIALLCAETLNGLWEERAAPYARYIGVFLVAISAFWGAYLAANALTVPAIRVVMGTQSRSEYLTASLASQGLVSALIPASDWINANTPKDAKVALFDEVRGFYIDRPILWANPNHAYGLIPWDSYATVDDWLADFKRRGYTTLLVADALAPKAGSPLLGQKWRSFILEAVANDKVQTAFEAQDERGTYVHVYRIP